MKSPKVILPNALMLAQVSEFLSEGRSVIIMTKGDSMSPFIRGDRDSVELEKLPHVAVGDIVLCELRPGHYVLHRVHALDGDAVTLKGDGNLDAMEHCTLADVRGTAVAILRRGSARIDCRSARFGRRSRRWVAAPRTLRRYVLGIYRRVKIL